MCRFIPGVIYHIANQVETKVKIEIRDPHGEEEEKKKSFHTGKKRRRSSPVDGRV